jgi:hypothetical protein
MPPNRIQKQLFCLGSFGKLDRLYFSRSGTQVEVSKVLNTGDLTC